MMALIVTMSTEEETLLGSVTEKRLLNTQQTEKTWTLL
jgi:hypothetical protein